MVLQSMPQKKIESPKFWKEMLTFPPITLYIYIVGKIF